MPEKRGLDGDDPSEAISPTSEVEGGPDDSDLHHDEDEDDDDNMAESQIKPEHDAEGKPKKKLDPKDPNRPRRKKARRACFACQKAHLTCGDERPCERCIKRGLADVCQDGVRKKAKYLHDAPPEALRPVLGPAYSTMSVASARPNGHRHPSNAGSDVSSGVGSYYPQAPTAPAMSVYGGPAMVASIPESMPFASQQSPISPSFPGPANSQMGPMSMTPTSGDASTFSGPMFDPSNPAIFNFNLDGINFGSQYAALEFGMLNHMSSGAAETPPREPSLSQQGAGSFPFGSSSYGNGINQHLYDNGMVGDFLGGTDRSTNGYYSQGNLQHGLPHAYAIAAGPQSLQSPSTDTNSPQATTFGFEGSPSTPTYTPTSQALPHPPQHPPQRPKSRHAARVDPHSLLTKRQREPSAVYETVKEPYAYVKSFHRLIAVLKMRLSSTKVHQIAKSLASVRAPLISCIQKLDREDLVFMEKSFQRTIFEYCDFISAGSSPAILCRRTGEVAAVNKEFTALTGWTKEILLGKEPNLNINTSSGSTENSGKAGLPTPHLSTLNSGDAKASDDKSQPMFIAELMDDDNVVEFYEDYSHLAFGDSRGYVMRKCRLLKYQTHEMLERNAMAKVEEPTKQDVRSSILSNRVARIDGEHGISRLGKDGKLDCSYCWSIKRDTFDIPMMIVMNFLPCYYPDEEPHQLAV